MCLDNAYVTYVNEKRYAAYANGEAMRKPRQEMIAETRGKLIAAGRRAFGTIGYAEASMDDFTGEAGLTRGPSITTSVTREACSRPSSSKSTRK